MDKVEPKRLAVEISRIFLGVDLPKSNNSDMQRLLCDLYIANMMASKGNARKAELADDFKSRFIDKLEAMPINEKTELAEAFPFSLLGKVSNPRNTFDKDAFIKRVAEKYDLSLSELGAIARDCNKQTAAPISFEVVLKGTNED